MKYYLIAGEASGDLHAGNLVKEIRKLDQQAEIRAWGGDRLVEAGAHLVKHYRDLAFMGFWEVIRNLRTILRNLKFCKKDILDWQPDVLILVDYPGFNLRIAKWAKQNNLRIIYYISPQVWAWKENRVKMMKECIDKMIVILPFEKEYFATKWNWQVDYVGHPLLDEIERVVTDQEAPGDVIAILPGSRKQEIMKKLPIMIEAAKYFPGKTFVVAKAPGVGDEFYSGILQDKPYVKAVSQRTYELLSQSSAAMVTSGTATLETALFGVPQVVCYKGSAFSYQIARRVIRVKFISLVNLILNREVVKELIQDEMNAENLRKELESLLNNEERVARIKEGYSHLRALLKKNENASASAAGIIVDFLRRKA